MTVPPQFEEKGQAASPNRYHPYLTREGASGRAVIRRKFNGL